MKFHRTISQTAALKFPSLFRAISSAKRRKKLLHHRMYGTSSKPATNNINSSKLNFHSYLKNTTDLIWRTVTAASSLINNSSFSILRTSNSDGKITPHSKEQKVDIQNENSEKAKSTEAVLPMPKEKTQTVHNMKEGFFSWLTSSDLQKKRVAFLEKNDEKNVEKTKKVALSKLSLQLRSRFLVYSLTEAVSSRSRLLRLEEVCKHLLLYPEHKTEMCKVGLVRIALNLKYDPSDVAVQSLAQTVLSLVGYHDPPQAQGIRILSIDGGGTRGIMSIEVLRQLEAKTNKKVYQLFDFICGVSSGAILSLLLGGLRSSVDECESLYRTLSDEVFSQSTIWGTGRLMWSHAYYDTTTWVKALKKTFGEKLLIDISKDKSSPKVAAVSAVMNLPELKAFVFRNYDFPPRVQSHYLGSCKYKMWEAIRASGAAPGYFEEYCLDDYLHQDGGLMINNPTALAIHEARLLWPTEPIQCVLSLGNGRCSPSIQANFTSTSLKTKVMKVIDSATDTEAVHVALNDLLTPDTYFRINPYLTEFFTLDENREEKLDQMKRDAQMYLRRNEYKFTNITQNLCIQRSYLKRLKDWIRIQKDLVL